MSQKHLKRTPFDMEKLSSQNPTPDAWFYEENGGFFIIINGVGVYQISWRRIRAALRRKDLP